MSLEESERAFLSELAVTVREGDERDNFIRCPTCGQWVDCRQLRDTVVRNEPDHEPLPASRH